MRKNSSVSVKNSIQFVKIHQVMGIYIYIDICVCMYVWPLNKISTSEFGAPEGPTTSSYFQPFIKKLMSLQQSGLLFFIRFTNLNSFLNNQIK